MKRILVYVIVLAVFCFSISSAVLAEEKKDVYLVVCYNETEKINEKSFLLMKPEFGLEFAYNVKKAEEVFSLLNKYQPKFLLLVGDIPVPDLFDGEQKTDFSYAFYKNIGKIKKDNFFNFSPDVFVGRVTSLKKLIEEKSNSEKTVDLFCPIGAFPWRQGDYYGLGSDFSLVGEKIRKKYEKSYDVQFVSEKEGDMTSAYDSKGFSNFEKRKTLLTFAPSSLERNLDGKFVRSVWTDQNKNGFLFYEGNIEKDEIVSTQYLDPDKVNSEILITMEPEVDLCSIVVAGCSDKAKFYYYNVDSAIENGFQNLVLYLITDNILSGKSIGESIFGITKQYEKARTGNRYEWELFALTYFTCFGDPSFSVSDSYIDLGFVRQISIKSNQEIIRLGNHLELNGDLIVVSVPIVVFYPSGKSVFFGKTYFIAKENGLNIKYFVRYKILNLCVITPSEKLGVLCWLLFVFIL